MKLEKAIQLGEDAEKSLRAGKYLAHADAVKLLIEAGKVILHYRKSSTFPHIKQLPGETDE